ncbi:uridine kinase [Natronomonas halophila]|uniref:uridine kinase n=1 Tax=Natronomonas halophila TaxID=2747817 RepID=UPI0015B6C6CE|nr:uridine kinase [Natronomonas halophila]QLD86967.1 uridine kinase [Natronomonas halophila]
MLIGIAGGSGAGKTTIAQQVTEDVADVRVLPLDNYYRDRSALPPEERARINYDHPDAFDWDLVRDHLDALESGDPIEMPQYDFEEHRRTDETVHVAPGSVVVIEGILALYDDEVRERLDLRLYVETDADVRVLRRIQRDVEERGRDLSGVIDQYLSTVKPMHEQFVRPTKRDAHLIIPEGANEKAVELLRNRIA